MRIPRTPFQLLVLGVLDLAQLLRRDAGAGDHVVVEDAHPALADRAHRQFRLPRHPQFADEHDVQIAAQRRGDLFRDGHTPARQAEHEGALGVEIAQSLRERTARLGAIGIDQRNLRSVSAGFRLRTCSIRSTSMPAATNPTRSPAEPRTTPIGSTIMLLPAPPGAHWSAAAT